MSAHTPTSASPCGDTFSVLERASRLGEGTCHRTVSSGLDGDAKLGSIPSTMLAEHAWRQCPIGKVLRIFAEAFGLVAASEAWAPQTSVMTSTWVSARKQNRRHGNRLKYILTLVPPKLLRRDSTMRYAKKRQS